MRFEFDSETGVTLPLAVTIPPGRLEKVSFLACDENQWQQMAHGKKFIPSTARGTMAFVAFAPRGIGPSAWTGDAREQVQIRRRFMLLGQTLDGMRVWDIRRALEATRQIKEVDGVPVGLSGSGGMAVNVLYASLFEEGLFNVALPDLPTTHQQRGAPDYLNVLRYLDMPAAVAMAAEGSIVILTGAKRDDWRYVYDVVGRLDWKGGLFEAVELE